jgi:hypothetical protein
LYFEYIEHFGGVATTCGETAFGGGATKRGEATEG